MNSIRREQQTKTTCQIRLVGKRRDGGNRYWCFEHKADATEKYGERAKQCRYANVPIVTDAETFSLDIDSFPGGVALWGAVPPVYDTTRSPLDRGIHVHARVVPYGRKDIDQTYRRVQILAKLNGESRGFVISELDAIYFMASQTFGVPMKYVQCPYCAYPHLDKDWFSVHPHYRHLCAGCGRHFEDNEKAVGNPICQMHQQLGVHQSRGCAATESLEIRQHDFPGGVQIWGSNHAIVWTGEYIDRQGIHVHAFRDDHSIPAIDETYATVTIDGVELNADLVRLLMVQAALPHLQDRVTYLECPDCGSPHACQGTDAFTPTKQHKCAQCSFLFSGRKRLHKLIGNPTLGLIDVMAGQAARMPQIHQLGLVPETI